MKIRKSTLLYLGLTFLAFILGCGQESTDDTVARAQHRASQTSHYIANAYQPVTGSYRGGTPNSDILLLVRLSKVSKDGVTVPQPTLSGVLIVSPKLALGANSRPIQIPYPFSDGIFERKELSFTIEKESRPSEIHCKLAPNGQLNCNWHLRTPGHDFALNRTPEDEIQNINVEKTGDWIYTGHGREFKIALQLNTAMAIRDGSQIPEPSIMGYITFFDKKDEGVEPKVSEQAATYAFRNGSYDLFSDTLTINIDSDTRITFSCRVKQQGKTLSCKWSSRVYDEFDLVKTPRH